MAPLAGPGAFSASDLGALRKLGHAQCRPRRQDPFFPLRVPHEAPLAGSVAFSASDLRALHDLNLAHHHLRRRLPLAYYDGRPSAPLTGIYIPCGPTNDLAGSWAMVHGSWPPYARDVSILGPPVPLARQPETRDGYLRRLCRGSAIGSAAYRMSPEDSPT